MPIEIKVPKPLPRKLSSSWGNIVKDSDRDGIPDVMDCKPYDPKKQGKLHDWLQRRREERLKREQAKEEVRRPREEIRLARMKRQAEREKAISSIQKSREERVRSRGKAVRAGVKSLIPSGAEFAATFGGDILPTVKKKEKKARKKRRRKKKR